MFGTWYPKKSQHVCANAIQLSPHVFECERPSYEQVV